MITRPSQPNAQSQLHTVVTPLLSNLESDEPASTDLRDVQRHCTDAGVNLPIN